MAHTINCLTCKAIVGAEEISSYVKETTDKEYSRDFHVYGTLTFEQYIFLKCPICLKPCIICVSYDTDTGYDEDHRYTKVLYPAFNRNLDPCVPEPIRISFNEAMLCFENKAFTASVIMCRKVVEGIYKESKIEKNNLRDKLIAMKEQGIIESSLFE